jgi:hypothetical protein
LRRYEIQELGDSSIPGSGDQSVLSGKFQREVPGHISTVRARRNKLEKSLAKISKSQIRKYLKGRKEALRLMLQGSLLGNALHKARKVIKEIMYLEAMRRKADTRELYFGQLDELIGQWHDRQQLLDLLKKAKSLDLERLRSERDKTLRNILKSVTEFYTRKRPVRKNDVKEGAP